MKYADKIGARYSVIIGDDEISDGVLKLKNMQTGEKVTLPIDERFKAAFNAMLISHMLSAEEIEEPFDELESGDITD